MTQFRLSVVGDRGRETSAALVRAVGRRPQQTEHGARAELPEGCTRRVWLFETLEDTRRARADVQRVFGADARDRVARELFDRSGSWARAEMFNANGEQVFDELASGLPQRRVPQMTPGRYRWTFDTRDEARAADQRAVAALRDVPAHLRVAARSCTMRTLGMMLTELPTTTFASPGHWLSENSLRRLTEVSVRTDWRWTRIQ